MPTPLGHSLMGMAVWAMAKGPGRDEDTSLRERAGWAGLCVAAANLPDADFVYISEGALHVSGLHHHGITHSLGFALAAGAVVGLWAWLRKVSSSPAPGQVAASPQMAGALTFLGAASHSILDLFGTDTNPINGIGLPILWPLSGEYFVIPLIEGIDRTNILSLGTLACLARETLIFGAILLAVMYYLRTAPAPEGDEPVPQERVTE